MSSGFFRGTNTEQDSRWGDAEKKLLRRTKFSKVLEQKVNMKKVNMDVMQRWITQRITSLLGFEDDIVVGTCVNYLSEEGNLDPKKLQLQLTGFLEKSTGMFMEELWGLLVDAQNSIGGIPSAFIQDKKDEILQAKEQERKQEEELQQDYAAYQKMGSVTTSTRDEVAIEPEARISLQKPSEGRRASRWGISAAVIAQTNPLSTPGDGIDGTATPEGPTPSTSPRGAADHSAAEDSSEFLRVLDTHKKEREDSAEKSRKHYRGRRDRDEASASAKEKKRKSKSKHGKKSSRKKSKKERRNGQDRDDHRDGRNDRDYVSEAKDDDGGSSSDNEANNDVEETLRLKVIASVASRKTRSGESES